MSAKPVRVTKRPEGPSTPVVIKSGGGLPDNLPEPLNPVVISSPMAFVESEPGPTWESSQSTLTGRLTGLTITDEGVTISCEIPNPGELASITIKYGSDQLIVRESPADESKVVLTIESPEVPFKVPQIGDWKESTATFPHLMKSVTLMVGDQSELHHDCHSAGVELEIDFTTS